MFGFSSMTDAVGGKHPQDIGEPGPGPGRFEETFTNCRETLRQGMQKASAQFSKNDLFPIFFPPAAPTEPQKRSVAGI